MLQQLRDKMKTIMLIVLLAFLATIIFSWGMGGFKEKNQMEQGVVGKVYGQKILYQNYARALEMEYDNFRKTNETEEISDYQREQLKNQVWYDIVQELIFAKEIKKQKLFATPDEVVFQLRYNPPAFLRSNEQFQTEGQFDIQKYHQALNNPQNYQSWIPVENYMSQMIPRQKLGQYIISTIRLTPSEMKYEYKINNIDMNAEFIHFDPIGISNEDITVTDDEINHYYKENKDDFKVDEQRKIAYVVFDLKPSYHDSMQTRQEALDLIKQLNNGADFEELAQTYSEDEGSAQKGGDLGFFGKGQMVKPFEEAAFNAKTNEIVGPIESQFGTHIIQVLGKKKTAGKEQVHARHILLKFTRSNETFDCIYEDAKSFSEEAQNLNVQKFKELALSMNYNIEESPLFKKGNVIPGIGFNKRIIELVFNNKYKWVSTPINDQEKYYVLQITDIMDAHIDSLGNVQDRIKETILKDKKLDLLAETCEKAYNDIQSGESFETVAEKNNMEIYKTNSFKFNTYIQRVGRDYAFSGAAYKLEAGEVSSPVKGNKGYYLIKLLNKTELSEEALTTAATEDQEMKLQNKQQTAYMKWYKILEEEADLEDYRYIYF